MNANQIINMVVRMVMRRVISGGINAGMKRMSRGRGPQPRSGAPSGPYADLGPREAELRRRQSSRPDDR